MKSTMTEREFEKRLGELLMSRSPTEPTVHLAKQVAREAGLEFVLEPKLPDRLRIHNTEAGYPYLVPDKDTSTFEGAAHLLVSLEAARDRYNAYPGLRKAFEILLSAAREERLIRFDALKALEAELAKGPTS